ncbi:MAG TPA: TonB-dependent receptor [Gemmatimonadaceae bacterium]|nr:TonB-dependent receptor [Gemmatimonadaceae bacterium]
MTMQAFVKFVFVSCGLALCASGAAAQGAPPAQRPAGPRSAPQAGNAEIRGVVREQGGEPVPGAAISVRSRRDSALVAGALAGADGRFRVQGLLPGNYSLRVTRIGFAPRVRPFAITTADQRVDLDSLQMSRAVIQLEGVAVTEQAATMTMTADRNSYRAKEVSPGAANASEVLENVPSVAVDADGKVSLRGNENVVVQINGRPSPLRGAQLASFLKGLPGPVVERVEVVPNPSAKYDPEGMAGIINIVLKQDTDLGASGGVNTSYMNSDRWNASGNAGWQRGRVSLFGSYGYNTDLRTVTGVNDQERFNASRTLLSATDQDITGTNYFRGHNLSANFDFRATSRDVLSQALVVNKRAGGDDSRLAFTERDASMTPFDTYLRPRFSEIQGWVVDYTSAWKRTVVPRQRELSTELRYNNTVDDDSTLLSTRNADGSLLRDAETQQSDSRATQLTGQLDYLHTVGKLKVETGYRGNSRWLDRDFIAQKDSAGTGEFRPSALSNKFGFDEHVQAGYAVLSRAAGKFDLQGGLRAEYTSREFTIASDDFPYRYFSLFPSAAMSYKVSDATQARLSYSRRIRRPGTQELNPFPQFFDAQNVFKGNPSLRPEFTDAIEFGLSRSGKNGSVQFSPFFRRTTDVIRVDIDTEGNVDNRPVTTISFVNLATSNSFGADLNGTRKIGKWFNGLTSFNVFRLVTDGGSQSALGSTAVAWSGRVNGTFNVTQQTSIQLNYFYRAPFNVERGRFGAVQGTQLIFRQKVMGDRASLIVRGQDIFNTNRFIISTGSQTLQQYTERSPGVRGVFVGFQYATGQTPRLRAPRNDPQAPQAPSGFTPP